MLANEAKFLGPKFMGTRWILTAISIIIMAIITVKLVKKQDLPMDDIIEKEDAILAVDESFCIGCGLCTRVSPDDFEMLNKKAKISKKILKTQENENTKLAIEKCPAKAIKYM